MAKKTRTLTGLKVGDMVTCSPLLPRLSDEAVYAIVDTEATEKDPATVRLYWHDVYLGTVPLSGPPASKKRVVKAKKEVGA